MRSPGGRGQLSSRSADAGGPRAVAGPARSAAPADVIVLRAASEQDRSASGPAPGYPEHLRAAVETRLESLRFGTAAEAAGLEQAMRYSLLAGGKRIRPVLTLATASAIGRDPEWVLPLATSIELIHTYSLIHDDLPAMDDDDLRRGRPTCHRAFGEDVAILAGDGLYAEAFVLLLTRQQAEPTRLLAAAAALARATGAQGMVAGQYIDVAGTAEPDPSGLRRLHELKTGRLIAASVECVLLLAGLQDAERVNSFERFARELGVLFQIVDDILDVTGSPETLGKQQGSDERLGKRTYVTEFGLDGARELVAEAHTRARAALAQAAGRAGPHTTADLEQITDFIATRSF
ncbi:MAG: polyprenyl synthetase family protein [Solirubrobacterales bacterium]|nr:polyprenyl synthetase family protein [Solirubrobacterales bacterium]